MRSILIFLAVCSFSISSLTPAHAAKQVHQGTLIREIQMQGFVLGDKNRFTKLFKPYRDKYLTTDDMNSLLQQVRLMYEREGYLELVSINYQVVKHRLIFTVLMTS